MLTGFLNFLGFDGKESLKQPPVKINNTDTKENMEEFIIDMQSSCFQEEIVTENIIKDGKKIEIKKIKTIEPLSDGKTLVSVKTDKKDITRI